MKKKKKKKKHTIIYIMNNSINSKSHIEAIGRTQHKQRLGEKRNKSVSKERKEAGYGTS